MQCTDSTGALEKLGVILDLEERDPTMLSTEQLREIIQRQKLRLEIAHRKLLEAKQQKDLGIPASGAGSAC